MKIIGLIIFLFVSLSLACGGLKDAGIQGSGTSKKETRDLSGFKKIQAENAVNLNVTVQKGFSVSVEADDNLLTSVLTRVDGDTLVISLKDKVAAKSLINITVSMPDLTTLGLTGVTTAEVTGIKTDEFTLNATGASRAMLEGEAASLKVKAVGASSVDAEGLKAEKAVAESVGASRITVFASNELKADAVGASHVIYSGDPKDVKQNATDVSTISKK